MESKKESLSGKKRGSAYIFLMLFIIFLASLILIVDSFVNLKYRLVKKNLIFYKVKSRIESQKEEMLLNIYKKGIEIRSDLKYTNNNLLHSEITQIGGMIGLTTVYKNRSIKKKFWTKFPFEYGIYYGNKTKPLNIRGKTEIKGGLSTQRSCYVDYDSCVDLINRSPSDRLPEIDGIYIKRIIEFYNATKENNDFISFLSTRTYDSKEEKMILNKRYDFYKKQVAFGKNIIIKDSYIVSESSIIIKKNCVMENSTIIAPVIYIGDKSRIEDCEIVAFKKIIEEKEATLNRVNILLIGLVKDKKIEKAAVYFYDKAFFNGNILILPEEKKYFTERRKLLFKKGKDVTYEGSVINYGVSELEGEIRGSVYSYDFTSGKEEHTISNLKLKRGDEIAERFLFGIEGKIDEM